MQSRKKKGQYNIYRFLSFMIILFVVYIPTAGTAPDTGLSDTSILKKITTILLKEVIDSTDSLGELASRVGITVPELEQICKSLGIDISRFTPRTDIALAHTVEMLKSDEYEPEAAVELASSSPYVLIVEKSTHTVFLLKYEKGKRNLVAMYDCKTGMESGDKQEKGDLKTPDGIYFFNEKLARYTIQMRVGLGNAFQYGDLAFPTDYPNSIDILNKKSGNGIWLHGTDEEFTATSALDTHGCVVTTNGSIKELAKYITLNRTPMIIVEQISFLSKLEHEKLKQEYMNILLGWRDAWQAENLEQYISYYSREFTDNNRNLTQYQDYKKNVFASVRVRKIDLTDIVVIKYNQGLVFQFNQNYSASNLTSRNIKFLYLVQQADDWKIIAEVIR